MTSSRRPALVVPLESQIVQFAVEEDRESRAAILQQGCEIVELDAAEHNAFVAAVKPIYGDARQIYPRQLFDLLPRLS